MFTKIFCGVLMFCFQCTFFLVLYVKIAEKFEIDKFRYAKIVHLIVILGILLFNSYDIFKNISKNTVRSSIGCCSHNGGVCSCSKNGRVICCNGTISPSCDCY